MNEIITEITPLSDKDCFYLVDRYKNQFDYPIHRHAEVELNFVSNCRGARRVVGDSIDILGDYDMALIGGNLEHGWENNSRPFGDMREITIQFPADLISGSFLMKNQMATLRQLLENAKSGIAFGMATIMKVYSKLDEMTQTQPGFQRVMKFLEILYILSMAKDVKMLSSESFSNCKITSDSRRVRKVEEYITENYHKVITLNQLASIAGMTPTAFSRFFKLRTGRTITDYIIDLRLGYAARQLIDSTTSIVEICYECGFNNVSNFNRIFKRKKGCSPKAFRDNFRKNRVIV